MKHIPVISMICGALTAVTTFLILGKQVAHLSQVSQFILGAGAVFAGYVTAGFLTGWK